MVGSDILLEPFVPSLQLSQEDFTGSNSLDVFVSELPRSCDLGKGKEGRDTEKGPMPSCVL